MTALTLTHLTLNTGHTLPILRGSIPPEDLWRYEPILDHEEGPLPGAEGWFCDVMVPQSAPGKPLPGAFLFQFADQPGMSKTPAVMGIACWRPEMERDAWSQVLHGYGALKPALKAAKFWRDPPTLPPKLPWLVVWLTPFIATADQLTISGFGRAEQALALAAMERDGV